MTNVFFQMFFFLQDNNHMFMSLYLHNLLLSFSVKIMCYDQKYMMAFTTKQTKTYRISFPLCMMSKHLVKLYSDIYIRIYVLLK